MVLSPLFPKPVARVGNNWQIVRGPSGQSLVVDIGHIYIYIYLIYYLYFFNIHLRLYILCIDVLFMCSYNLR